MRKGVGFVPGRDSESGYRTIDRVQQLPQAWVALAASGVQRIYATDILETSRHETPT